MPNRYQEAWSRLQPCRSHRGDHKGRAVLNDLARSAAESSIVVKERASRRNHFASFKDTLAGEGVVKWE
jgi:hypothetical protein